MKPLPKRQRLLRACLAAPPTLGSQHFVRTSSMPPQSVLRGIDIAIRFDAAFASSTALAGRCFATFSECSLLQLAVPIEQTRNCIGVDSVDVDRVDSGVQQSMQSAAIVLFGQVVKRKGTGNRPTASSRQSPWSKFCVPSFFLGGGWLIELHFSGVTPIGIPPPLDPDPNLRVPYWRAHY